MALKFSKFGEKFNRTSGITQLMDDLNDGLQTLDAMMLGGGNPASIPAMNEYFIDATQTLLDQGGLIKALTNYDGPQGNTAFIAALATLLNDTYGWSLSEKNITLTTGSQSSFFYLFNLLAGTQKNGQMKNILLPMTPEYIGYADVGLDEEMFVSYRPEIELLPERRFKYHVDFEQLHLDDSIAAMCVSRPTNPTGNVLTDEEVIKLDALARKYNIPLIIDNAYGMPFPNIIFENVTPFWNGNTILCMSLSKLGLPGVRCGIVIASEAITQVLTNMNGVMSLAPSSIGPIYGEYMLAKNDLLRLSQEVIKPFYAQKSQTVIDLLHRAIPDVRFRIHKSEGAIFLWLWFEDLPITTMELYQQLKARGLLIVPGEFFFIGQPDAWSHTHECLRINYVQAEEVMERGISVLAEEITKAYEKV